MYVGLCYDSQAHPNNNYSDLQSTIENYRELQRTIENYRELQRTIENYREIWNLYRFIVRINTNEYANLLQNVTPKKCVVSLGL